MKTSCYNSGKVVINTYATQSFMTQTIDFDLSYQTTILTDTFLRDHVEFSLESHNTPVSVKFNVHYFAH